MNEPQRTLLISLDGGSRWMTVPVRDNTEFRLVDAPILSVNPNYCHHAIVTQIQISDALKFKQMALIGPIEHKL